MGLRVKENWMNEEWMPWAVDGSVWKESRLIVDNCLEFKGIAIVDKYLFIETRIHTEIPKQMMKNWLSSYPFTCKCDFEKAVDRLSSDEFWREYGSPSSSWSRHEMFERECCLSKNKESV
jgi:hypothetical protein